MCTRFAYLILVSFVIGCTLDKGGDVAPPTNDDDAPAEEMEEEREATNVDGGRTDAGPRATRDGSPNDRRRPDAARPLDSGTSPPNVPPTSSNDAGGEGDAANTAADATAPMANYDWVPGDYPPNLMAQDYLTLSSGTGPSGMRQFKVHVPKSYDRTRPTAVLYAIHGLGQNAVLFVVQGTDLVAKSDAEGFILIMPNGLQQGTGGSWNAGVCCGPAATQQLDDVAFIRAVHAEVSKHVNVDARRVYATGLSNGGFLSYRLACEAADLFTAVAPVAGAIGTPDIGALNMNANTEFKTCEPSRPVAVLALHGDADPLVPYRAMAPSLQHFGAKNGCSTMTTAATQPMSGGDTTCVTYSNCKDDVEVTGCTVEGGGHCWFGDDTCGTGAPGIGPAIVGRDSTFLNATNAAWEFLKRFERGM